MRTPIYAANWKLQKTNKETDEFFNTFIPKVKDRTGVEIIIAPPFTSLATAVKHADAAGIIVAAQNFYHESKGAFTGEISAGMVKETGSRAVIIGHSERRHVFGESDKLINKKILAAIESSLIPIFCIGELIEERESGKTNEVLKKQLDTGLQNVDQEIFNTVVIAYEPVWAIGTGKTATPEIAQEAHAFVRDFLTDRYTKDSAEKTRILYGGSVKPSNIADLMAKPDLDGVLVGGASLDPDSFASIVNHD